MDALSPQLVTAFFVGFGALVTSSLGFAYKIWKDHNRMIKEMNETLLDMVAKNSQSNERQSTALFKLSDNVTENTIATKASTDMLSKLMLELIRSK